MSDREVDVKIIANTGEFSAGMATAADDFAGAADGIKASAEEMTTEVNASVEGMAAKVSASLTAAKESFEGFDAKVKAAGEAFSAFGTLIAGGILGEKLKELIKNTTELGVEMGKTSQELGIPVEKLSELKFAASMTEVSFETLQRAVRGMARRLGAAAGGSAKSATAFDLIGGATDKVTGKMRPFGDILAATAEVFKTMPDGPEKTAAAMQMFGRAGSRLIPLLNEGKEGLAEHAEEARKLGVVYTEQTVAGSEALAHATTEMHAAITGVSQQIVSSFLPGLTEMAGGMTKAAQNGGSLNVIFTGLAYTLKGIIIAFTAVKLAADEAMTIIITTVMEAVHVAEGLGHALWDIAHGQWSKAYKDATLSDIHDVSIGIDQLGQNAKDTWDSIKTLAGGATTTAHEEGGAAPGGGEGGAPPVEASTSPPAKAKSQLPQWQAELTAQKEASGEYFKSQTAMEESFWEEKLSHAAKGSSDYIAIERQLYNLHKSAAQQSLANDLQDIRSKISAASAGSTQRVQLAEAAAQRIGAAYGLESRQYKQAQDAVRKEEDAAEKYQEGLLAKATDAQKTHDLGLIALKQDTLETKKKLGEISDSDRIAGLKELKDQEYQIELYALEKKKTIYASDLKQVATLDAQILALKQKNAMDIQKLDDQMVLAQKTKWDKMSQPIVSAFDTTVKGMIAGTTTLQKAMQNMVQSILAMFIDAEVKKLANYISTQAALTSANAAGNAARLTSETAAHAASASEGATTGLAQVMSNAYKAAAGAYQSVVGIQFVGPILAPIAAATAFAAVAAFGSGVSAEGGYDIPAGINPLVQTHQREMILPQKHADTIRNLGENGGAGETHLHFHSMTTDRRSVEKFFQDNSAGLSAGIYKVARTFQPVGAKYQP